MTGPLDLRPGRHAAIIGPTASGKSSLALEIARRRSDVELVSVDSMQVYRGMDIGTVKPTPAEQAEVPHHLIDLVDPWEDFSVARYQDAVGVVLADIEDRGNRALFVGGTGLYLRAVIDGLEIPGRYPEVRRELDAEPDTKALHERLAVLDAVGAARMEPSNRRRIVRALEVTIGTGRPFSSFGPGLEQYPATPLTLLGVHLPRPVLDVRIRRRYDDQVADGFVDEVCTLVAGPSSLSRTARQALGYRELLAHIEHDVPLEEAIGEAVVRTCRFARRQERWFRRDPRIHWHRAPNNPMVLLSDLLEDWSPCT